MGKIAWEEWEDNERSMAYLKPLFNASDMRRRLPAEAKLLTQADRSFQELAKKFNDVPSAIKEGQELFKAVQNYTAQLEQIQKGLNDYLESKRMAFPRFYFLSNDDLLAILSQTKDPQAMQPYLNKCFDGIDRLEFGTKDGDGQNSENDILAMFSKQNEKITLEKGLKAEGAVEDWLVNLEDTMVKTMKSLVKSGIADYETQTRKDWILSHCSQVVLTVPQILWCRRVTDILVGSTDKVAGLKEFEQKSFKELIELAALVRGDLPKVTRTIICSLLTIDVHARDKIKQMIENKCDSVNSFSWQSQLRYYWDPTLDECMVKMTNSKEVLGYEYQGVEPRLVITPLTDRCYISTMTALQLNYGSAPCGPAGTGKTETLKDLGRCLGRRCVVINCSDQLDYKSLGKIFSGTVQSGAWTVFDEFNRIDIEVLSVVAQQLAVIKNARAAKLERFLFEGHSINLKPTSAVSVTMNPGYAGRTELPDNLKALFRPCAMMIPDYALISIIMLYSEGYETAEVIGKKLVQTLKLCSEQLSSQDHYDFGMRAVKSILNMAGQMKRQYPKADETSLFLRALTESSLPKFLDADAERYKAIVNDLFPGVNVPEEKQDRLENEVRATMKDMDLVVVEAEVKKILELYNAMTIRHGVTLIGPTGSGKSTIHEVLSRALSKLGSDLDSNIRGGPVKKRIINPKSVTMDDLYGRLNSETSEYQDGLISSVMRKFSQDTSPDHKWIIFDGPVDALWVENLNAVLDDNKRLGLEGGGMIPLTPSMRVLFEVEDLKVASPATVSRCGMIYTSGDMVQWKPYVHKWVKQLPSEIKPEIKQYILELFEEYVGHGLRFVAKKCTQTINQIDVAKVQMLCKLMESLLFSPGGPNLNKDQKEVRNLVCTTFVFCYLWSVGGNIESNQETFDELVRQQFDGNRDMKLPSDFDLRSYYINFETWSMEKWEKLVPPFTYNKKTPFHEMLVPTVDTVRFGYLMEKLLAVRQPVLYIGHTGVGKTAIAKGVLKYMAAKSGCLPCSTTFSATTSSKQTQEMIESKLEKRGTNTFGAPRDKQIVFFVDDLNMPRKEVYGAQPPLELLRQQLDYSGFYDSNTLDWKEIQDVTLAAACGLPGGGRNTVSQRLTRHFAMLTVPEPSDNNLKLIFGQILDGFPSDFPATIRQCSKTIVSAAVEIYNRFGKDLLPTPSKCHYTFNLRDLSQCFQGVLQANSKVIQDNTKLYRLFCHEATRVFGDRLINNEDQTHFFNVLADVAKKQFGQNITAESFAKDPIIFGDFMKIGAGREDQMYEELTDVKKVADVLQTYLDEYNKQPGQEMKLVFFLDAVEHVSRIIRIIRQERGNALLVGMAGSGKQSLARLSAHICGYTYYQVEKTYGYDHKAFRNDLRNMYHMTGIENKKVVLLLSNAQNMAVEILEDINNLLNSGEVPNLFEGEEKQKVVRVWNPAAKADEIQKGDHDDIFDFFINRVRNNLHCVLCMSAEGDAFRNQCRMFPALVNSCTIDWFNMWSRDALLNVSKVMINKAELAGHNKLKDVVAQVLADIHTDVCTMVEKLDTETKRSCCVTPTSYVDLINLFLCMLDDKSREIKNSQDRTQSALTKLADVKTLLGKMPTKVAELKEPIADQESYWQQLSENLKTQMNNVVGDTLLSAACLTYYGPFTGQCRQELYQTWMGKCAQMKVPVTPRQTMMKVLTDSYEVQQWNDEGLPKDQTSIDNAVLVTRGRHWPLIIDPQEQANAWVRNKEGKNRLKVVKQTDVDFVLSLATCVQNGTPLLCEDIGDTLHPALETLLSLTSKSGIPSVINLGEREIQYDPDFRLYMTSKMPTSCYLPEVCTRVNIINFAITKSGLEDQILSEIVAMENPDLEQLRIEMTRKVNSSRREVKMNEDGFLKYMAEVKGNILEPKDLFLNNLKDLVVKGRTLQQCKTDLEKTNEKIRVAAGKYRAVAAHGSMMYFVLTDIGKIDPMYQYSLNYFKDIFTTAVRKCEKSSDVNKTLDICLHETTQSVYRNVARGLFEKDRLAFAFLLCVTIMRKTGTISPQGWSCFLRGSLSVGKEYPVKPNVAWISHQMWENACELEKTVPVFQGICNDLTKTPCWVKMGDNLVRANPEKDQGYGPMPPVPTMGQEQQYDGKVKGHWDTRLTAFQKLLFIKALKNEKTIDGVRELVSQNLGKEYLASPETNLPDLYADTNKVTPLVFIQSRGADPTDAFMSLAKDRGYADRVHTLVLGQGQGAKAEKLIEVATMSGGWVFLKDCHLNPSWMMNLENIVNGFKANPDKINDNFRLFLSTMPSDKFPVSVIKSSVKVIIEPPKGVKAIARKAFAAMTPTFFENHKLGADWQKCVYGICLFHAAVQERSKFGPLGWNIQYEFRDCDKEFSLLSLEMLCADGAIPWDALTYLVGEVTFGGRVTDDKDRRCMNSLLKKFLNPDVLTPGYKYEPSGIYNAPGKSTLDQYRQHIEALPDIDKPEFFGMNENANIAFQKRDGSSLVSTLSQIQPFMPGDDGKSNNEVVNELADSILNVLVDKLDMVEADVNVGQKKSQDVVNALSGVLSNEVLRYNRLLSVIKANLSNLQKALKGNIVMSKELSEIYASLLKGEVPRAWFRVSYPSLKGLGSWVQDLVYRCSFFKHWIEHGQPKSFWLPGFFFPQGFLSAVLQNYARKYNVPVDSLSFKFNPCALTRDQREVHKQMSVLKPGEQMDLDKQIVLPKEGVLIHGLYMEGCRWDMNSMMVVDSLPGELTSELPMLHLEPAKNVEAESTNYEAPLYKTTTRAGVLSTTGHSTNFVTMVSLKTGFNRDYWITKGAALFCQLSE